MQLPGETTRWIILDRDGVINRDSENFIKNADEWIPIEGSIEAIGQLSRAGFRIVVITNQSGVGRGLFDLNALNAMHKKMHSLVQQAGGKLEGVFYCPHAPDDNCACRKPEIALFNQVEEKFATSLTGAYAVGDSRRDLEAAIKKQCKPVLVLTGKGKKTQTQLNSLDQHQRITIFSNLHEFAENLLSSNLKKGN